MKKLYIAPDMEELRFQALEAMAADGSGEFEQTLPYPDGEDPFA